jgi:hypothetical protein
VAGHAGCDRGIGAEAPRRETVASRAGASLGRAATGVQQRSVRAWRRWRRRVGDAASSSGRRDGEAAASLQQLSGRAAASPLQRGVSRQVGSGADGARMAALWAPLLFIGDGETRERAYLRSTWRYLVRCMRDSISRDAISGD